VAGGSTQREYERRHVKRQVDTRARHPHVGGLMLALRPDPQTTTSWATGAKGERKLGARLDNLADSGVVVLHDRLRPGTNANIDHLGVAPSGVWVIDAKCYTGQVAKRDGGGWFSSDVRLYVGRRDCSRLIRAMATQVDAVRDALGTQWGDVPVQPVVCFVDAEWRLFTDPFELDGVLVAGPRALCKRVARPGPYGPDRVKLIAAALETGFRPGS